MSQTCQVTSCWNILMKKTSVYIFQRLLTRDMRNMASCNSRCCNSQKTPSDTDESDMMNICFLLFILITDYVIGGGNVLARNSSRFGENRLVENRWNYSWVLLELFPSFSSVGLQKIVFLSWQQKIVFLLQKVVFLLQNIFPLFSPAASEGPLSVAVMAKPKDGDEVLRVLRWADHLLGGRYQNDMEGRLFTLMATSTSSPTGGGLSPSLEGTSRPRMQIVSLTLHQ